MKATRTACLVMSGLLSVWCATPAEAGLVLVRDGRPAATIVTAEKASPQAQAAAAELRGYIEKITGASLPAASDAATPAGTLILVGRSRLTDEMPDLNIPRGLTRDLREEGFVVRTAGDRLVLAGNESEPYLGTRYAVVEFLHGLGVRWFLPGEIGEVVPRMTTIEVGPLAIEQRPDFPIRNFWEHARGNMAAECLEWKIHHKLNPFASDFIGVPGDSSIRDLLPDDAAFKAHPEWFAQNQDGSRNRHHPCMTSDEMIAHMVARVKDNARMGRRVTSFAPDDGNPRCWCAKCGRIANSFDGYGSNDRDPVPESSASNEWFYFVNRILAEVNKEFPDHLVATNGYANRDIPPEMPPDIAFNPSPFKVM